MSKIEKHKEIVMGLNAMYAKKNADYGDSFSDSLDEFGVIASVVRMSDKLNRLKSLTINANKQKVNDESLEDTLEDLANYAIMTSMWLKLKKEKESESVKPIPMDS